ncbi:transcriptional regulator, AraC family [Burkholderia sp. D7]|nr:transcriptional regulator, AraC family [Burkholderia sp. D7]
MIEHQHGRAITSVTLTEHPSPVPVGSAPAHEHDWGQLLVAVRGLYSIEIPGRSWLIPTRKAVWIPSGVRHRFSGRFSEPGQPVADCSLYIPTNASPDLPRDCRVIEVSTLLFELISAAIEMPSDYLVNGRESRITGLIVDEICRAPSMLLHLPMPRDPRLQRICRALVDEPGHEGNLEDWARHGALSLRSLTRLFRAETGLTFSMWRQQVRLMEALTRLGAGASVTSIALELGYDSPSAFTAMFRRAVGCSPKEYLATYRNQGIAPTPSIARSLLSA